MSSLLPKTRLDNRILIWHSLRYHRTVASIANAGSWIVDDVDETLEAAASPSMYVLDSYSGCSYYILRACRAISKLAASVERREIRELKDLAARIKTMSVSSVRVLSWTHSHDY